MDALGYVIGAILGVLVYGLGVCSCVIWRERKGKR